MISSILAPIFSAIFGAVIGALATAYFSSRSISIKLAELDTKIYKIAEVVVKRHEDKLHQSTVEDAIQNHKIDCGNEMKESLDKFNELVSSFNSKIQHMELKQTRANFKINLVSSLISEIAKKMQVSIDPTKVDGDEE